MRGRRGRAAAAATTRDDDEELAPATPMYQQQQQHTFPLSPLVQKTRRRLSRKSYPFLSLHTTRAPRTRLERVRRQASHVTGGAQPKVRADREPKPMLRALARVRARAHGEEEVVFP